MDTSSPGLARHNGVRYLLPAMRAIGADLDRLTRIAHIMVDLRQARHLPLGVFGQVRHEMRPGHPMRGQAILVGGSFIFKEIFRFIATTFRYEGLRIFDTEDEAWIYVRKLIAEDNQVDRDTG